MAPVHVAPVPAVGVVLIEEVIRTRVPDQPVGVIEPAAAGREVELGTMSLLIDQAGVGDLLGLGDAAQPRESGSSSSRSILSVLPRYGARSVNTQKSGLTFGQLDLELADGPAFERELHPLLQRAGADGQVKVTMCDGQLAVSGARLPGLVTLDDLVTLMCPNPRARGDLPERLRAQKSQDRERIREAASEAPGKGWSDAVSLVTLTSPTEPATSGASSVLRPANEADVRHLGVETVIALAEASDTPSLVRYNVEPAAHARDGASVLSSPVTRVAGSPRRRSSRAVRVEAGNAHRGASMSRGSSMSLARLTLDSPGQAISVWRKEENAVNNGSRVSKTC